MARLQTGERIAGRYLLRECIGDGGHAAIWSALDERNDRAVALKVLRPGVCDADEAWTVLRNESQLARRVDHPGVLWVDEPQRDGEQVFLPMEYATGGDIKPLRGAAYQRSVPILIRVAQVLAQAHSREVIHRDIKPGNVLLDASGAVRVADFGSAADSGSQRALAAGSPFSASPQQLRGDAATPADDIYGLGALAYELLSGYPPFYPDFDMERVLTQMPAPLRTVHPAPSQLSTLVMSMLARDPAARPSNMREVIASLQACLPESRMIEEVVDSQAGVQADSTPHARPAQSWRLGTGKTWMVAGAVASVLALLLIAGLTLHRARPEYIAVTMVPGTDIKSVLEPAADAGMQGAQSQLARAADASSAALAQELQAGRAALAAGQVALARAAFERALKLEAGEPAATQGLADATRLERVLAIHSDAIRAEASGHLQRAAELFASALKVDATFAPAIAGLARVHMAQGEQQFALALGQGAAALQAGKLDAAQSAYSEAARMRADDARVRDGLAGVAAARRRLQDSHDLQAGADLERQEKWADAVVLYESVVARDSQLQFAQQGLERSRKRAALARQLEDFSARPERLSASAVRASAQQVIAAAQGIAGPAPVLGAQVARVRELLTPYAIEAQVEISSDNSTRVFIGTVGDLGVFLSREVLLSPGKYTVVGTRAGFRDVRLELNVAPGQRRAALSVLCSERI
ncbi:MAG: protein kinase [Pseudomonadota bacterium]